MADDRIELKNPADTVEVKATDTSIWIAIQNPNSFEDSETYLNWKEAKRLYDWLGARLKERADG